MDKKLEFKADKMSGLGASIFATSMVIELMSENERQNIFRFQFYALSINHKEQRCDEWINNDLYHNESMHILDYINTNGVSYFEDISKLATEQSVDFFKLAKEVILKIPKLSDFELMREYARFMNIYIEYYGLGCVTFIYETELSQYLNDSLASRYDNVAHILSLLLASPYKSFMTQGEPLLLKIRNETDVEVRKQLISKYVDEFFFIQTSYCDAPILTEEAVLTMAEHVHSQTANVYTSEEGAKLTVEEKNLVGLFRETEIIRDQRKRTNLIGSFTMFRFLNEVCRRKNINIEMASRMFWFELAEAITSPEKLILRLKDRNEVSLVYDHGNILYLEYPAITARKTSSSTSKEVKGTPASKGKVQGVARIVLSQKDFHKFRKGEILFSEMTRPDYLPLMKGALAIVTDEGGLTCHAAIVARELNIPCIVGTRTATEIFKDGDLVEVDAEKGTVTIVK